jgi:hypothetical protein
MTNGEEMTRVDQNEQSFWSTTESIFGIRHSSFFSIRHSLAAPKLREGGSFVIG